MASIEIERIWDRGVLVVLGVSSRSGTFRDMPAGRE